MSYLDSLAQISSASRPIRISVPDIQHDGRFMLAGLNQGFQLEQQRQQQALIAGRETQQNAADARNTAVDKLYEVLQKNPDAQVPEGLGQYEQATVEASRGMGEQFQQRMGQMNKYTGSLMESTSNYGKGPQAQEEGLMYSRYAPRSSIEEYLASNAGKKFTRGDAWASMQASGGVMGDEIPIEGTEGWRNLQRHFMMTSGRDPDATLAAQMAPHNERYFRDVDMLQKLLTSGYWPAGGIPASGTTTQLPTNTPTPTGGTGTGYPKPDQKVKNKDGTWGSAVNAGASVLAPSVLAGRGLNQARKFPKSLSELRQGNIAAASKDINTKVGKALSDEAKLVKKGPLSKVDATKLKGIQTEAKNLDTTARKILKHNKIPFDEKASPKKIAQMLKTHGEAGDIKSLPKGIDKKLKKQIGKGVLGGALKKAGVGVIAGAKGGGFGIAVGVGSALWMAYDLWGLVDDSGGWKELGGDVVEGAKEAGRKIKNAPNDILDYWKFDKMSESEMEESKIED